MAATYLASQSSKDTILRTRGMHTTWLDATSAPGVSVTVGIGLILVPDGTGTTVLWSPLTDPNAPWFVFDAFTLAYEEKVTDVISVSGLDMFRSVVDSKAMRKIPPDTEIQCVVENATTSGASAGVINQTAQYRMLLGR